MKFSIITATLNNVRDIKATIDSVLSQNYADIEYIIVDGGSTDGSENIIADAATEHPDIIRAVTLPANGVYNAINHGINLATGDVIGLLHGNDRFTEVDILTLVALAMKDEAIDVVFGDVYFVKPGTGKVVRRYSAHGFTCDRLLTLFAPPHPTLFVRREVYEKYGLYKEDYVTAADFEYIARILGKEKLNYKYIPVEMVEMTDGGMSTTFRHRLLTNPREKARGLRENGMKFSLLGVIRRYFSLIFLRK